MVILRSGVDMVELGRLEALNPRIRERFLRRVFTPGELAETDGDLSALAGRFAVKEAVSKALGTGIGRVHWQDIETRDGPWGAPQLRLHGFAREVADALGLSAWSISISDTRTHAVAIAVAIGESDAGIPGQPAHQPGDEEPPSG
jgi:holo-[acyl-carrier protein] synthase